MSLEHTILKVIEERQNNIEKYKQIFSEGKITEAQYREITLQYKQSINDLYMVLTSHDNPQSQFSILHSKNTG